MNSDTSPTADEKQSVNTSLLQVLTSKLSIVKPLEGCFFHGLLLVVMEHFRKQGAILSGYFDGPLKEVLRRDALFQGPCIEKSVPCEGASLKASLAVTEDVRKTGCNFEG